MRSKKATVFGGWVTHEMKDEESEWNRTTRLSARFAEHANVSGNRTGRFRQVKTQQPKGQDKF